MDHPTIGRSTSEEQDAWEIALLTAMENSDDVVITAEQFGTTIHEAQAICYRRGGHEWTHWEAGDGVWFQSGGDFCAVCGWNRGE